MGEKLAVEHLIGEGFHILEQNWRYQKAEIDIIAQKEGVLVAVEVKTRSNNLFGDPQDFVDKKKIGLMVKAIDKYVCDRELKVQVRFDIVAILHDNRRLKITHLKDAFFHFYF